MGGSTIKYGKATLFCKPLNQWFRNIAERMRIFDQWKQGTTKDDERFKWTEDKIFQTGRFCNIFRFHDRTSVWLLARVIAPLHRVGGREADILFNIFICRSYLVWEKSMAEVCTHFPSAGGNDLLYVPCANFCHVAFEARLGNALAKLGRLNQAPYLNRPIMKRKGCSTHLGQKLPPDPKHDVKLHRYAMFFAYLAPRMQETMDELSSRTGTPYERSAYTFQRIRDLMCEWTGEAWAFVAYQVCIDIGYVRPDLFNESAYVFVGATG